MKHSKKGQAAFEYLVTYGWAFLVILVAIGVLSYFGFLNPQRYIPDSCDFGEQIKCVDYLITNETEIGASGHIILRLRNNFEKDIRIVSVADPDGVLSLRNNNPVTIGKGEIRRVEIAIADSEVVNPKDKVRFHPKLEFRREKGTILHNVSGTIFAEVVDSSVIPSQLN